MIDGGLGIAWILIMALPFLIFSLITSIIIVASRKRSTIFIRILYSITALVSPVVCAAIIFPLMPHIDEWLTKVGLIITLISPYLVRTIFVYKHPEHAGTTP